MHQVNTTVTIYSFMVCMLLHRQDLESAEALMHQKEEAARKLREQADNKNAAARGIESQVSSHCAHKSGVRSLSMY
jgi:predicted translin family RNA/ssDNA-binding protein